MLVYLAISNSDAIYSINLYNFVETIRSLIQRINLRRKFIHEMSAEVCAT